MIVENCERMTTSLVKGKVSHEIHLPEKVGSWGFKTLELPLGTVRSLGRKTVPATDCGDGVRCGDFPITEILQPLSDLSASPHMM